MKQTVTKSIFIETFRKVRPDNFSHEALVALFEHYEELEQDTEEQIEFDPIAICCEWTEYERLSEVVEAYNIQMPKPFEDYETDEEILEVLREELQIITFGNDEGVLVSE